MSDQTSGIPVADPDDAVSPLEPMPAYWGEGQVQPLSETPSFAQLEYGPSVTFVDSDYSGSWNHAVLDVDGDGTPDLLASVQGDNILLAVDSAGDGRFSHTELVTPEQLASIDPALAELLVENLPMTAPEDADFTATQIDYEQLSEDSPYWFEQAANGLCVPASVAQIVAEYTGMTFENEADFVELANEYGLFTVGPDGVPGMSVEGSLFLMEQAGVPASLVMSANVEMLDTYLDSGYGVVLFVNSSEIWYGEDGSGTADHALVIEEIDDEAGVAVLSDPGHPEGNGFTVPIAVLEEAWAAGNNTMLVAEEPAPEARNVVPATPAADERYRSPEAHPAEFASAAAGLDPEEAAVVRAGPGPQVSGGSLEDIELHTGIPAAMQWLTDRPWLLLPVVIGASRLIAR